MGDVVNLNRFRKSKERETRKQLAAVNRHKFARPKAELVRLDAERGKHSAALDAHRLGHAVDTDLVAPDPAGENGADDPSAPSDDAHAAPDDPHDDDNPGERPGAPRETD